MLKLKFEISKQFINRVDQENPVANSMYYLFAHFDFLTDEWSGKVITAIFTKDNLSYYTLLDADGDCLVPREVIKEGDFYVSVFTGELITTNESRVHVNKSGYTEDAENSQPPTPNIYDQLTSQFGELRTDVYYRLDNIDGGLFTDWENEGS